MIQALVAGAFGLFGAAQARRDEKNAIAQMNAYNNPAAIRARAEAAGFNPLLFIGPGVGSQTAVGGANYMGAAIAEAGLMVADAASKQREAGKLSRLTQENAAMRNQVQNLTLRPKVGGVYAQRAAASSGGVVPSVRPALRGPAGASGVPYGYADYPNQNHPLVDGLGVVSVPDPTLDRAPGGFIGGARWEALPGTTSPAEMEASNWGDNELLSYPYGLAWAGSTIGYNIRKAQNYVSGRLFGSGPVMSLGGSDFVMQSWKPKRPDPRALLPETQLGRGLRSW